MNWGPRTGRAALALALASAAAVTGISGIAGAKASSSVYGHLPKESGTPAQGGVVSIAETVGAGPYYILPIVPANYYSVYVISEFQAPMYRPLYWVPTGATTKISKALSLASLPQYSDNDQVVTINLHTNYKWSNGGSVDAQDVVFFIDLLKAAVKETASNSGAYTPGQFPDNVVSATATSTYTVTLKLNASYNPEWFTNDELTTVVPFPVTAWATPSGATAPLNYTTPANAKTIYDNLANAAKSLTTYATNPLWQVVDGPYQLQSFNTTTNAYSFVPNKDYGGPQKSHVSQVDFLPFTSTTAEFDQLLGGKLTAGYVGSADLSQVSQLEAKGYNVFGLPDDGFNFIMLNFKDKTDDVNKILGQHYIREALDSLIDESGYIKSRAIYNGAATATYGTSPATSQFAPSTITTPPYPYSVTAAKRLLTSHGWKVVPGGTTTCAHPGSGPTECGAGIPKGHPIEFAYFYNSSPPVNGHVATALAAAAREVGIVVTIKPKPFSYLIQHFNDPAAPATENNWSMEAWGGFAEGGGYPTASGIFNTTGTENVGGYDNATANRLMHASVYGNSTTAVTKEIAYLRTSLPVLWLPSADNVWAWKTSVSGPPSAFANLPDTVVTPEYWYFKK